MLIGENNLGKSAILEAIKMVLRTHAYERFMWVKEDFYEGTDELRIELWIDGLTNSEAAHFTNGSDGRLAIPKTHFAAYMYHETNR